MADYNERANFLRYVREYVEKDPEVVPYITEHVQAGLKSALDKLHQQCSDMEAALVFVLMKFKNGEELAIEKIKKWKGKTYQNWESFLNEKELKGKV